MRKIPTLFRRDAEDMTRVVAEVYPGCRWVLDGEGEATRKYDGTCVMFDGVSWWARREVKPGRTSPSGFRVEQHDDATGKTVGWEPIEGSPFVRPFREALAEDVGREAGTYELIGPKINGNPEAAVGHRLVPHAAAERLPDAPRDFGPLMAWLLVHDGEIEGVVWHHPDGRRAKIKVRDARSSAGRHADRFR